MPKDCMDIVDSGHGIYPLCSVGHVEVQQIRSRLSARGEAQHSGAVTAAELYNLLHEPQNDQNSDTYDTQSKAVIEVLLHLMSQSGEGANTIWPL